MEVYNRHQISFLQSSPSIYCQNLNVMFKGAPWMKYCLLLDTNSCPSLQRFFCVLHPLSDTKIEKRLKTHVPQASSFHVPSFMDTSHLSTRADILN